DARECHQSDRHPDHKGRGGRVNPAAESEAQPINLRAQAEALAAPLPVLLAEAEHLASTVLLGDHGRRRAGQGDTFWQYRPAMPGDEMRNIDWRRSGRADAAFIQDKEWQI